MLQILRDFLTEMIQRCFYVKFSKYGSKMLPFFFIMENKYNA